MRSNLFVLFASVISVIGIAQDVIQTHKVPTTVPFVPQTKEVSGKILLDGEINMVFPLFGPIREAEWAEGWEPVVRFPPDGKVRAGMVFTIQDHDGNQVVWLVTEFDEESHRAAYVHLGGSSMMVRIEIVCRPVGEKQTEAQVSYSYTGLDENGNRTVGIVELDQQPHRLHEWEQAIQHLLKTGKRYHHGA